MIVVAFASVDPDLKLHSSMVRLAQMGHHAALSNAAKEAMMAELTNLESKLGEVTGLRWRRRLPRRRRSTDLAALS
jgi:hypothetical protein